MDLRNDPATIAKLKEKKQAPISTKQGEELAKVGWDFQQLGENFKSKIKLGKHGLSFNLEIFGVQDWFFCSMAYS